VLYLGEIHDRQQAAWRKSLDALNQATQLTEPICLFPEDREIPPDVLNGLQVNLCELTLHRPCALGDCWLACRLWDELPLGPFWRQRLPDGKAAVPWFKVLELLVVRQPVSPGSKWHLHRRWFLASAMDHLLDEDFAVANNDTFLRLIDLTSLPSQMPAVTTLGKHQSASMSVAFSPNGHTLVSASVDHTLKLGDVLHLKEATVLKGHRGPVRHVAFSPDGATVASVSDDRTFQLWSPSLEQDADVLRPANDVAFSGDGKWLATGNAGGTIRLLETVSRQAVATFPGHRGGVSHVLFSKDSKLLISAGAEGAIRIWDVVTQSAEPLAILTGHQGRVHLRLAPDGRVLLSANRGWGETYRGVVKFWDLSTRREIASLPAHPKGVWAMTISPDGRILATPSFDHTVRLWPAARFLQDESRALSNSK
jgi:WD40 repeat protein